MTTYSVSRVKTFLDNPWKHWCKYLAGYKEKQDPEVTQYMDRGTYFHRGMELLAQSKGKMTQEELYAKLREIYTESGFLEEAKLSGELAIDRYLSEGEPVDFEKIIETEHQVYYDLPNGHQFTGIIDAVIQNDDGTVTIVDYKTHSTAPTDDEYRYSLQGNLYMYVYTQLGYNVRDMIFDCVNPKIKITGRNYKRKTIRLVYNEYRTKDFFDQFVHLVDLIESDPEFKLYIPGKSGHKPDAYDYLYKVYIGEMMEDLDEFIEKNFQKRVDSPTQK